MYFFSHFVIYEDMIFYVPLDCILALMFQYFTRNLLISEFPPDKAARNLTLIAKTIQTLANSAK